MPVAAFALNNSLDVDKKCPLKIRGNEAAGLKCLNGLPDLLTFGRDERSTLFWWRIGKGSRPVTGFVCTPIPCRSWLASEGALESCIDLEDAFAGKPAPAMDLCRTADMSVF
jgi:hypothetical protein